MAEEQDSTTDETFIEGDLGEVDDPEFLAAELKRLELERAQVLERKKVAAQDFKRPPYSETGYKQPRDRKESPIAINPRGFPIFAYNENGIPICNALIKATSNKGPERRCQNPILGPAGRCRVHNGFPKRGIEHGRFKTGEYASYYKDRTLGQLLEAAQDPDYLNLQDELALNFVQITSILEKTSGGFTESSLKQIKTISEQLENIVFASKISQFRSLIGDEDWEIYFRPIFDLSEKMVRTVNSGMDEFRAFRSLNEALKVRKTLIDTDLKRKQLEQNNISADKMLSLFATLCSFVVQIFGQHKTELEQFAMKLDEMASHPTYRSALNSGRSEGYSNAIGKAKPILLSSSDVVSAPIFDENYSEEDQRREEIQRQIEKGDLSNLPELKTKKIKLKL